MMMQNHDYQLEALRREHMMQKAKERQQADQHLTNSYQSNTSRGIVSPTLAGMGRVLSNIGDGLQQRYGDLSSSTNGAPFQTETA